VLGKADRRTRRVLFMRDVCDVLIVASNLHRPRPREAPRALYERTYRWRELVKLWDTNDTTTTSLHDI